MPDTISLMKQRVLDMAIRGELVEQREEEGNAIDLLAKIKAKKELLILSGERKKGTNVEFFQDKNAPFGIPQNWSWARINELVEINLGFTYKPKYVETGKMFLSVKDLSDNGIDLNNAKYISEEEYKNASYGSKPRKGDVLFGRVGTLGKPRIVDFNDDFCIFVSLGFFRGYDAENFLMEYLCYWMESGLFWSQVEQNVKGSAQQNLNTGWLKNFLIPLPPLAEQERIVSKIESLFTIIDKISEKKEDSLKLIDNIRKTALQDAVMGKLVEQDEEDEPASELVKEIQLEKECAVKSNKMKREKALEPLDDDEKIFDIPSNWEWVKLGDLTASQDNSFSDGPFGSNLKTIHYTTNPEVRIIQLNNVGEGKWKNGGHKYTTYEHADTLVRCNVNPGDIVIAKMMPAGRAIIVPDIEQRYILSSDNVKFVPNKKISPEYIRNAINSSILREYIAKNSTGTTRVRTSSTKLRNIPIPLPPLAEQKRIVEKLDKIMAICDQMEEILDGSREETPVAK